MHVHLSYSVDLRESNSRLKLRWTYPKQKKDGYLDPSTAYAVACQVYKAIGGDCIFKAVTAAKATHTVQAFVGVGADEQLSASQWSAIMAKAAECDNQPTEGRKSNVRIPLKMPGFSLVYYPNVKVSDSWTT